MHFVNDFRSMTPSGDPTQPGICKFGEPRSRNGFDSVGVDNIWNQMDSQNDKDAHGDEASRVAVVEAEGWEGHREGARREARTWVVYIKLVRHWNTPSVISSRRNHERIRR